MAFQPPYGYQPPSGVMTPYNGNGQMTPEQRAAAQSTIGVMQQQPPMQQPMQGLPSNGNLPSPQGVAPVNDIDRRAGSGTKPGVVNEVMPGPGFSPASMPVQATQDFSNYLAQRGPGSPQPGPIVRGMPQTVRPPPLMGPNPQANVVAGYNSGNHGSRRVFAQ